MIIAIINKSTRYNDKENILHKIADAINIQLTTQVCPAWGLVSWECKFYTNEKDIPNNAYKLLLIDGNGEETQFGTHDKDINGIPYGKIFVEKIISVGGTDYTSFNSISVVLSHEACEIVADPHVNIWRQIGNKKTIFVSQEICDPVQFDAYPINLNGENIFVSNFLFPEWFNYSSKENSKLDFMNKLKKPFTMTAGGYMLNIENGKIIKVTSTLKSPIHFELRRQAAVRMNIRMSNKN